MSQQQPGDSGSSQASGGGNSGRRRGIEGHWRGGDRIRGGSDGKVRDLDRSWRRPDGNGHGDDGQGGETQTSGPGRGRGHVRENNASQNTTTLPTVITPAPPTSTTSGPYTSNNYGAPSKKAKKPTGKEPIHEYKGIKFIYNGEVVGDKLEKMNLCMEHWVDDYIREDGTVRGNNGRPDWKDWKPKYALVSKLGPHRTSTVLYSGIENRNGDQRLHNTLHFISEIEWVSRIPRGQGLHIYVDDNHKYIPTRKRGRARLEADELPNHEWGGLDSIVDLNRPFIIQAKEFFDKGIAYTTQGPTVLSEESEGKNPEEQATEKPRLTPISKSTRVLEDSAGVNYWKEGREGNEITIGVVDGKRVENYKPQKGKKAEKSSSSTPASASAFSYAAAAKPKTSRSPGRDKKKTEEPASASLTTAKRRTSQSPGRDKKKAEESASASSTTAKPNASQNTDKTTKDDGKVENTASSSNTTGDGETTERHVGKDGLRYKRIGRSGGPWQYLRYEGKSKKTWKKINRTIWKESKEE